MGLNAMAGEATLDAEFESISLERYRIDAAATRLTLLEASERMTSLSPVYFER